jgi:ribose 5-phosphate isomerase B
MTITIGCDHAGFPYKDAIIRKLKNSGHEVIDHGTYSVDSVDYPDFVHPAVTQLEKGNASLGILLCGSGNGVAITANKHQHVRAALCWKKELAALARQHNNANVLCIPVRFVSKKMALAMVDTFLESDFEGGRHQRRVNKISCG